MKKLFYIFAILIGAAVLTSCNKEKVVAEEEDVIVESAVDTLCAAPADSLCAAPADTLVVE